MKGIIVIISVAALLKLGFSGSEVHNHVGQSENELPLSMTFYSEEYHIDTIYKSMMGPQGTMEIRLGHPHSDKLIWVTGYETSVVSSDGISKIPDDFMCHSNLDMDLILLNKTFKMSHVSQRVFTLSQGQMKVEFPEGFGIPTLEMYPFQLVTQVLNLNQQEVDIKAKHKVTINYVPNELADQKLVPLLTVGAYGLKGLDSRSKYFGIKEVNNNKFGQSCLVGESARPREFVDKYGHKFTGHWIVPPGREINRTNVTQIMDIPFNTTVHYIAVHVHPFAESVELLDLTTGQTVFKSNVINSKGKIGIESVEFYSDKKGTPVFEDHQYQLISIYNNTTDVDQDAMAVMYLYLRDKGYKYY